MFLLSLLAACSLAGGSTHPAEWSALQDGGYVVWASTSGDSMLAVQEPGGSMAIFLEGAGPFGQRPDCEGTGTLACRGGSSATPTVSGDTVKVAFTGDEAPPDRTLSRVTGIEAVSAHYGTQSRSGSPETKHLEGMFPGPEAVWKPSDMDAAIARQGVNPLTVSPAVGQCVVKQLELDVLKVMRASQMPSIDADEFAVELVDSAAGRCLVRTGAPLPAAGAR